MAADCCTSTRRSARPLAQPCSWARGSGVRLRPRSSLVLQGCRWRGGAGTEGLAATWAVALMPAARGRPEARPARCPGPRGAQGARPPLSDPALLARAGDGGDLRGGSRSPDAASAGAGARCRRAWYRRLLDRPAGAAQGGAVLQVLRRGVVGSSVGASGTAASTLVDGSVLHRWRLAGSAVSMDPRNHLSRRCTVSPTATRILRRSGCARRSR